MKSPDTTYIRCRCGCEVIAMDRWEAFAVDLAMLRAMPRSGIWYRIRHAWQVLRHGEPYLDDITIGAEEAEEIVEYLQRFIEDSKHTCKPAPAPPSG